MSAEVITTFGEMRERIAAARRDSRSIACVPTMGALHEGHGMLIDGARTAAGLLVVTVFVNPVQFDRKDDYEAYTRNLEADTRFCDARDVDVVFAPSATDMYPEPLQTFVDVPALATHLCGAFRPGHFRGVATVVAKLFNLIQPDFAYFGEKDLQQLAIVRTMARDLNFPVSIVAVPTVREKDGLAMSSRNVRLTPEERRVAPVLYRALLRARQEVENGIARTAEVRRAAFELLENEPMLRIEYLEVVDERMQPADIISRPAWLAAAVWLGSTRLIDNIALTV